MAENKVPLSTLKNNKHKKRNNNKNIFPLNLHKNTFTMSILTTIVINFYCKTFSLMKFHVSNCVCVRCSKQTFIITRIVFRFVKIHTKRQRVQPTANDRNELSLLLLIIYISTACHLLEVCSLCRTGVCNSF